jgi:hypothetical protein
MTSWAWTEPVVDLALALGLLWTVRAPLLATFSAIPRVYSLGVALIALLMLGGQAVDDTAITFPWSAWSMYTTRYPDPAFIDYTVEQANGQEERLLIARAFTLAKLRRRLDAAVEGVEQARSEGGHAESARELDALLAAVAQEYDAGHPDNPARTIRVWRCKVIIEEGQGPPSVQKSLITEYTPE